MAGIFGDRLAAAPPLLSSSVTMAACCCFLALGWGGAGNWTLLAWEWGHGQGGAGWWRLGPGVQTTVAQSTRRETCSERRDGADTGWNSHTGRGGVAWSVPHLALTFLLNSSNKSSQIYTSLALFALYHLNQNSFYNRVHSPHRELSLSPTLRNRQLSLIRHETKNPPLLS